MKRKIAVLFGGCSSEYAVSLESAYAVLCHIDRAQYDVLPIGITRDGRWYHYTGPLERLPDDTWHTDAARLHRAILSPDRADHGLLLDGVAARLDAVFPVLHGKNGEDGTVQGLCELAGIPVAGCGCLAGALGMDKYRAHLVAAQAGVSVPRGVLIQSGDPADSAAEAAEALGYPLFVKPLRAGSSLGISCVTRREDLATACCAALRQDGELLLEEAIPGFEVGCAILGPDASGALTVGEVDEIEMSGPLFDFEEKYTLRSSAIHVPARLPLAKRDEIRRLAVTVYRALGCTGFARVDLFVTPSGAVIFNEVNTIPGFTAHSRYPGMMKAIGLDFDALLAKILEQAVTA